MSVESTIIGAKIKILIQSSSIIWYQFDSQKKKIFGINLIENSKVTLKNIDDE